ncbi:hypothetical protein OG948_23930 [Embleya sp. NBC_00888]|uniref:SWIM zinc finger family protein n=1 Tax=Embleya sp. NBC_00888 TaxID=2975960 RepID=UPI003867F74F|nr:hypothetical protein OG948_23930 [Embleya sp. NBC_00888]
MEALPILTEQNLLDAAGSKSFEHGEAHLDAVANPTENGPGVITAVVYGNDTYDVVLHDVVLEFGPDDLAGECDCPYGDQGYWVYSQCTGLQSGGEANLRTALASDVGTDPQC